MKREFWFDAVRTLMAILLALLLGFVVTYLTSKQPGEAFQAFLTGPFSSVRRFGNLVETAIPITFTGLAVCIAFQAGQFNIGAEGQFFAGAVAATIVGIAFKLPPVIHAIVALLAAMVVGAVAGYIPGVLKAKWGASELVSSLMLNYVFFRFGIYLINYHFRDSKAGALASLPLAQSSWLSQFLPPTRIHWGLIVALVSIAFTYLFLYRSRWGYALRITGLNLKFAEYAGISTGAVIIYAQAISGAIAGLGGASEMLGMYHRFQWLSLPGYGFDGIIVAILARNNPLAVPFGALFLAYLRTGADIMGRTTDVSAEMITVIQAIIILLVTAQAFLAGWRQRIVVKEAKQHGSAA